MPDADLDALLDVQRRDLAALVSEARALAAVDPAVAALVPVLELTRRMAHGTATPADHARLARIEREDDHDDDLDLDLDLPM
jgi:hypothetical protein